MKRNITILVAKTKAASQLLHSLYIVRLCFRTSENPMRLTYHQHLGVVKTFTRMPVFQVSEMVVTMPHPYTHPTVIQRGGLWFSVISCFKSITAQHTDCQNYALCGNCVKLCVCVGGGGGGGGGRGYTSG